MDMKKIFAIFVLQAVFLPTSTVSAQGTVQMNDPSKTTYGEKNPNSPQELGAFSFIIG
jgi:hypothetical protein